MNILQKSAYKLAQACGGNPIMTTFIVMLFFAWFNILFFYVEKLVFGRAFVHFLDPILATASIAYSAYAVYYCAIFNSSDDK